MRKVTEERVEGFHLDLGEYWRVVWRKKYFLLVPLAISVVVSNIGVRFLVPIYESFAVIRVDNAGTASRELERFVGGARRGHDAETIARLRADLMGSAFLDELIRHLGMDRDPDLILAAERQRRSVYPGMTTEELVYRRLRNFLKSRISVQRKGPSLFSIAYADANQEACYVIAEAITDRYISLQQRARMEGLQEVSDFSEEQLAVYKERLQRSERALESFQQEMARRATTVNPVTEANVGLSETLRKDLDVTIQTTESTLGKIRGRLVELVGRVPDASTVWAAPEMKQLVNNLTNRRGTQLLRQLSGGAGVAADGGAGDVAIIDAQQAVQRHLSVAVRTDFPDVAPDYRPLVAEYLYQQADLESLRAKRRMLGSYISAFRDRLALAPQWHSELTRLQQQVEHDRTLFNTFQSSRTTTQISEAVQSTELGETITVVEAASKPISPVRPNRMKILALAVLFGLAVGGGGLLLTEFADSSFRSVEEVEKGLGLKVLGTVPRFDQRGRFQPANTRKRALLWGAASIVVVAVSLAGFYLYGKSSRQQMLDLNVTRHESRR